jgi:Cu+-exporting ATPase
MKSFQYILLTALIIITVGCKNEKSAEIKTIEVSELPEAKIDENATYAKAEFTVNGMTCEIGCAKTIEKKLAQMDGVTSAKVDFERKLAMVEYNENKVNPELLEETVTNVAKIYEVSDMKKVDHFSEK